MNIDIYSFTRVSSTLQHQSKCMNVVLKICFCSYLQLHVDLLHKGTIIACNKDLLTLRYFFHLINFLAGYCLKGSGGRAVPKNYEEPTPPELPGKNRKRKRRAVDSHVDSPVEPTKTYQGGFLEFQKRNKRQLYIWQL